MAVEECTALRAELTSFQEQVSRDPSLKAKGQVTKSPESAVKSKSIVQAKKHALWKAYSMLWMALALR